MAMHIGVAALGDLDAVISRLRSERLGREGLTQRRLADLVGVATGSLKDWEGRRDDPTMINFVRWTRALGFRLVIEDDSAPETHEPPAPVDDEGWELAEVGRLAAALRAAREHRGILQARLAALLGIARGSLIRWETGKGAPPRPAGLAHWARAVGCTLGLRPG